MGFFTTHRDSSFLKILVLGILLSPISGSARVPAPEGCGVQAVVPALQHAFVYSPEYANLLRRREAMVAAHNSGANGAEFAKWIQAENLKDLDTIRVFNRQSGLFHPDAKVKMVLLHGNGASISNSGSMRSIIRHLSDPNPVASGGTLKKLSEFPDYAFISTESFDQPGHGVGMYLKRYGTPEKSLEAVTNYFKRVRRETPAGIPIVAMTRSGSAALASRVVIEHPELIDGFVFMSPTLPGYPEILEKSMEAAREDVRRSLLTKKPIVLDEDLMKWADANILATKWEPQSFRNKPVLIITGSEDIQVTKEEREIYEKLSHTVPHLRYVDIAGAGHDVLRTSNEFKPIGIKGYEQLYKFLDEEGLSRARIPGPIIPKDVAHESVALAESLVSKNAEPLERKLLFNSPHHGESFLVNGVPKTAKVHAYEPDEVFRHYFTSKERLPGVVSKNLLDAEVEPYIIVQPGIKKEYYDDLVGTFLTTPKHEPWSVGLEHDTKMDYVDFTLPKGVGVIDLEPGIFLVPGKPAFPKWILDSYTKFKASGAAKIPAGFEDAFRKIEKYEAHPELLVPIKVKSYRKSGEIIHVD